MKTTIGLPSEKWVYACYLLQVDGKMIRIISPDWNQYPWCIANEHHLKYQAKKSPGKLINWAMDRNKVIEANENHERIISCKKLQP